MAGVTHTHFPFQIHTSGGFAKSVRRTFAPSHRFPQGEMASTLERPSSFCFLIPDINLSPPKTPAVARSSIRPSLLDPSSWTLSLSLYLSLSCALPISLCLSLSCAQSLEFPLSSHSSIVLSPSPLPCRSVLFFSLPPPRVKSNQSKMQMPHSALFVSPSLPSFPSSFYPSTSYKRRPVAASTMWNGCEKANNGMFFMLAFK